MSGLFIPKMELPSEEYGKMVVTIYPNGSTVEYVGDVGRDFGIATPCNDVRPVVRGEWGYRWKIHGDGRRPTELFPCSVCGFENTSATNFCPNCGADMREES